jgi:hypothetical protein
MIASGYIAITFDDPDMKGWAFIVFTALWAFTLYLITNIKFK